VANYPSYVAMTPSGYQTYSWTSSTTDVRGLQKISAVATDRTAACWYSETAVNFSLTFADRNVHQVALYMVDWDLLNRGQKIEILDSSNKVLDTRTVTGFTQGQYLVWNLSGRVTIRVTNNVGSRNAVVSGIFFR